jgi:hypothetical protein
VSYFVRTSTKSLHLGQLQGTILLSCVCVVEVDPSDSSLIIPEIALLLRREERIKGRVIVSSSSSLSKAETDLFC